MEEKRKPIRALQAGDSVWTSWSFTEGVSEEDQVRTESVIDMDFDIDNYTLITTARKITFPINLGNRTSLSPEIIGSFLATSYEEVREFRRDTWKNKLEQVEKQMISLLAEHKLVLRALEEYE